MLIATFKICAGMAVEGLPPGTEGRLIDVGAWPMSHDDKDDDDG